MDSAAALLDLDSLFEVLANLISKRVGELETGDDPAPLADLLPRDLPVTAIGERLQLTDPEQSEIVLMLLALSPDLQPHLLNEAIGAALQIAGDHPRIGGLRGKDSRILMPSGETLLFLLGCRTVADRVEAAKLFDADHRLARLRLFSLDPASPGEPALSGRLIAGVESIDRFTGSGRRRPRTGPDFPAELIETNLEWDDLVLDETTTEQIHELEAWVQHGRKMLDDWGMRRRIRPGYRALFFGPPGTGKTLTSSLLGKYTNRDVYRIDLSMVVSKFIGETEKNLAKIFAQAEDRNWLLFFDEADALFGKRTQVKDAHDRYANQEVAYLLQRIECFEGLVILASNFRSNIDDAFLRRFQAVVHFPKPTPAQRLHIWRKMLPDQVQLEESVNLQTLCERHELTGANIGNVMQYTCLQALRRDEKILRLVDIEVAIEREYQKEGRVV